MNKKKKKQNGFTIVELVIVIAVIGILAAVLIPTFSNLVKKAKESADQQLVYHINVAAAANEVDNGKAPTMYETLQALENDYGFTIEKMTPRSGCDIVWDSVTNRFALVENGTTIKYDDPNKPSNMTNKAQMWKITKAGESLTDGYSHYLTADWSGTVAVTTGVDVGENDDITSVTYERTTGAAQTVVIRTNGGTLTVNAPADTVNHYGEAQVVTLTAVADHSYYEHGSVNLVDIKKGRLVITNDATAEVGSIYLTATENNYDGIVLATMNGATLPEVVTREAVDLPAAGQKKLVAVVEQVNSNGVADATKTENIYLYAAQTAYEETKGYTGVSELGTLVLEAPTGTGSFTIKVKDGNTEKEVTVNYADLDESVTEEKTATIEETTSAAVKFAGGKGTQEKPYLIATAQHWNNFYQIVYDFNKEDKVAYFELANDIDLAGVEIKNYAIGENGDIIYGYLMSFVLDGKGFEIKSIESFEGYCQLLPYPKNATVKNITINFNLLNKSSTAAMSYSSYDNVYFTNVTTTGQIKTSANWASAFVAYPRATVYYTNCTNRANLTTNFTSNSYVAPFGSHDNASGVHIYFDNCKNFGNIAGGNVGGFVGMGNNDHFNFADENAVKNYGSLTYSIKYGYFQYGNTNDTFKTNNTNVTCTVKQSGSSNQKLATLTVNNPSNGEKLVINNIEGATKYVVTVSSAVQVYNYDNEGNANRWSGGFPRSMVGEYVAESGATTETAFINVALKESRGTKLNYQTDEEVAYDGLFVDEEFDINSDDVTVLLGNPEKDAFVLVSYKGEVFYYFINSEYTGLVSDGATSITLRFDVTAYNGDIVLGTLDTYSYTYSIGE